MVAVSIVAATSDPGAELLGVLRSLDAQTLPAAEFEVVVADSSRDGSAERLRRWAAHRPNATVLTVDSGASAADRLDAALQRARGEHVLVLDQRRRLTPRALELLLHRARTTGADVVLGRVVTPSTSGSATLPDDADGVDPSLAGSADCIALRRRGPQPDDRAVSVSALGRSACAIVAGPGIPPAEHVALEPAALTWSAARLEVVVAVRAPEVASAWLVVADDRSDLALPVRIVRDGARTTVHAVLDLGAEADGPFEDGVRDLRLRLLDRGGEVTLPLVAEGTRSAVIAGRPWTVRTDDGALRLDAGAVRSSVIGAVPLPLASVHEDVHGLHLALEHPGLHVHGDAELDARVLLGGFALPARLVCRDGRARLLAHIGTLAGTSAVSVLAGGGDPVPTGLRLRVDGVGRAAFEPRPRPKPPAAPGPVSTVQRLRRRLPAGVEPVARGLRRVPVLRRAYGRLIRR